MTTIEERFEHPVLTKIIGPLTYCQLKTIKDELKANAASIYLELGGGAHGYLGLVLTVLEYANVSATMFVRHVHPGKLRIPTRTSTEEARRLTEEHKEKLRLFKEMIDVEKALIKQLSQAIPSMYLQSFRNLHSNAIEKDIPFILKHLMQNYGQVEEDTV